MGIAWIKDSIVNLITSLGTTKDPMKHSRYTLDLLPRDQLENAYRGDWVARKIVDAPAEDATREWREWQTDQDNIELLEEVEKSHNLQQKLKQALIKARLYGGCALVMGVDQGRPEDELNFDTLGEGCLKFVHVMHQYELTAGPRIYDIESEWFGRPEYYTIAVPTIGAAATTSEASKNFQLATRIHPSRVVELIGNDLPDWRTQSLGGLWGDSILQVVDDVVRSVSTVTSSIASMIHDAKTDVIKIPDLSLNLSNKDYANKLVERFSITNMSKSTINALLLDKEEEWQRINNTFTGLPDIMRMYLMIASGAADIPASRMLGQAPRGLAGASSAGGEVDIRNYYDGISSDQTTTLSPALTQLDEVIIISALGKSDPSIYYEWKPLWQMDEAEKAEIQLNKAKAFEIDVNTALINEDALREARINQLIEDGTYAGLQEAVDEFGAEPEEQEGHFDPNTGQPLPGTPAAAALQAVANKPIPGQPAQKLLAPPQKVADARRSRGRKR